MDGLYNCMDIEKEKAHINYVGNIVEPLNNGHIGDHPFVSFIEKLSSLWGLKCTSIIHVGRTSISMSFIGLFRVSINEGYTCTYET